MREIKFRAWDKIEEVMLDWKSLTDTFFAHKCDTIFNDKSIILMQYTGLKDKNDVEIFEEDIVEYYECSIKEIEKVEFLHGCFCPIGQSDWIDNNKIHDMKIIGNIYENPELIRS